MGLHTPMVEMFDPTRDPGTGRKIMSAEKERKRANEGIRPEWLAGRQKRLALAEQAREYQIGRAHV